MNAPLVDLAVGACLGLFLAYAAAAAGVLGLTTLYERAAQRLERGRR